MSASSETKIYFTAGPAKIPTEVMKQVQEELLDYRGMGISVMEMSHRSKEFETIINETEANFRKLINVPDNYSVLFMHGGAKTQFDSATMNLCAELDKERVEYLISGSWSKMAAKAAEKYAQVVTQSLPGGSFTRQFTRADLKEFEDVTYRYYCDNETIEGVEFNYAPEYTNNSAHGAKPPLVCDMTSNFLSRPIDVSKYGVIFAGAQKNCGISGLTIVIVRKDLIGKHMRIVPTLQNYQVIDSSKSLHNTPLTFAIYIANLCAKWALERGGLDGMDRASKEKSGLLYDLIDNSDGFYVNNVETSSRSRMNVVFLLANKDLEAKFLEESRAANLFELKGHRSVGGFRASIYNGITLDNVRRLAAFMESFRRKYSNQ